jgi:hypothetical protein
MRMGEVNDRIEAALKERGIPLRGVSYSQEMHYG